MCSLELKINEILLYSQTMTQGQGKDQILYFLEVLQ
jgi:hypothetical protein